MRNIILGGAVALAFAGAAVAQDHSRMRHGSSAEGPAPTMVGPTLPTPDYIAAAGASDMFEIEQGKLARSMGKSQDVKAFGKMMVTEHMKTTSTLKASLKGMGMAPPPPALRPDQQAMVDDLRGRSGADFDRTYLTQQLAAHQEALSVHTGYAAGGTEPKLKAVAAKTAPIVQSHINQLTAMQGRMGG